MVWCDDDDDAWLHLLCVNIYFRSIPTVLFGTRCVAILGLVQVRLSHSQE